MFDFITIGGATQDIFLESDKAVVLDLKEIEGSESLLCFDYGEKIEIDKMAFDVGGGAVNAAVCFSNLGLNVSIVVKLGQDLNAKAVRKRLSEKNIDKNLLIVSHKYKTGFSVILTSFEGERTVLMHRGANSDIISNQIHWDEIKNTKWIYIASLSGKSNAILDRLVGFAAENNIKIAFNPGSTQLKRGVEGLKKVLSNTEVLVLNKTEASVITGLTEEHSYIDYEKCTICKKCVEICPQKIYAEENRAIVTDKNIDRCTKGCNLCYENCPENAIRVEPWSSLIYELFLNINSYGPKIIAITDGKKGVQAYDGKFFYSIPPFPANVVSTLGAGDAFASTFTAAVKKYDYDIEKALTMASINAASVVQSFGAQTGLRSLNELEHIHEINSGYKPLKKDKTIILVDR